MKIQSQIISTPQTINTQSTKNQNTPINSDDNNALQKTDTLETSKRTALQKHVDFFDLNGDHSITVPETYRSLRSLGIGRIQSSFSAVVINAGLGISTGAKWYNPLVVSTDNIAAGKHDSDTDIYDEKGNFVAEKFETLFADYDLNQDSGLSQEEFDNFRNRNKESTAGGLASKAEFDLLVQIAGTPTEIDGKETKVVSRARMAQFYDGSLFYKLAGRELPEE